MDDVGRIYCTVEDFMSGIIPEGDTDLVSQTFSADDCSLNFYKPFFDMAIIVTSKDLLNKVHHIQKHFQTKKEGFTTHCIFLPDRSKFKNLIVDLKNHDIIYAIVVCENSIESDEYDLYILHPQIEEQLKMAFDDMDKLITSDYANYFNQVTMLINNPTRRPHKRPNAPGYVDMTDEVRYYMCLMFDSRMLEMKELNQVYEYLLLRKESLEHAGLANSIQFRDGRPMESYRQNPYKYSMYEAFPSCKASELPCENGGRSLSNLTASGNDTMKNMLLGPIVKSSTNLADKIQMSVKSIRTPNNQSDSNTISDAATEVPPMKLNRAKKICSGPLINPVMIATVNFLTGYVSKVPNFKLSGVVTTSQKTNSSYVCDYSTSLFHKIPEPIQHQSVITRDDVIMPLTSRLSPVSSYNDDDSENMDVDTPVQSQLPADKPKQPALPVTPNKSMPEIQNKLKKTPPYVIELSDEEEEEEMDIIPMYNISAEEFINFFKIILNLSLLSLPKNNTVLRILKQSCDSLKKYVPQTNFNLECDSYRKRGCIETLNNIYSICNVMSSDVETEVVLMWNQCFKSDNRDLLECFYQFIKLLTAFKMFNPYGETMKFVCETIQKIKEIVNWPFSSSEKNEQNRLTCFSDLFHCWFPHHAKFDTLPTPETRIYEMPKNSNDLDPIIERKKIRFYLGPLLMYLIKSINSVHSKMETTQLKNAYCAIRTMRFCLRQIFSPLFPKPLETPIDFDSISQDSNLLHPTVIDEIHQLLKEVTISRSILFTEKHYEFLNCILDFSLKIESIITESSINDGSSLVNISGSQFLDSFIDSQSTYILPYHPYSELEILRKSLRDKWTNFFRNAFLNDSSKLDGSRILAEFNYLLPEVWRKPTYDQSILSAVHLYKTEIDSMYHTNPQEAFSFFRKFRYAGFMFMEKFNLPLKKALAELAKCQYILEDMFLETFKK